MSQKLELLLKYPVYDRVKCEYEPLYHMEVVLELRKQVTTRTGGGEMRVKPLVGGGDWISSNDYIQGDWVAYSLMTVVVSFMILVLGCSAWWGTQL